MPAATATAPAANGSTPKSKDHVHGELPYKFAIVPLKHLVVDAYQRPLTSFVEKIERNFDPALVGTLCLSQRSATKYAVIDGQTRAEGMKRVGLTEAPAIVYEGLSREQEAALFSKFQTERRGMTSSARFKAQVIAKDPTAMAIDKIVEEAGFRIDQNIASSAQTTNTSIAAVAALEFVYWGTFGRKGKKQDPDPELLKDALDVMRGAWPKLPDTAKSSVMIRGLGFFLAREPSTGFKQARTTEVQFDRLVARLSKVQPSELAKRAESLRDGRGMEGNSPAYLAEAIEAQYRKR